MTLAGANPGDFHLLSTAIGTVAEGTQQEHYIQLRADGGRVAKRHFNNPAQCGRQPGYRLPHRHRHARIGIPAQRRSADDHRLRGYQPARGEDLQRPARRAAPHPGPEPGHRRHARLQRRPRAARLGLVATEIVAIVPAAPSYAFTGPVTATVSGQTGTGPPFTITLPKAPAAPSRDWPVLMHDPRQLGLADSALDPHTLAPWSVPLGSHPASAPVVRGGVAYIGTDGGDVFAVDTTTHSVRWQQRLPGGVRAAPAAGEAAIIVLAGGLYGLIRRTAASCGSGRISWRRTMLRRCWWTTWCIRAPPGPGGTRRFDAVVAASGAAAWPTSAILPAGFEARTPAAAFPSWGCW